MRLECRKLAFLPSPCTHVRIGKNQKKTGSTRDKRRIVRHKQGRRMNGLAAFLKGTEGSRKYHWNCST